MKVRVLGCSGGIARHCRTTSFLLDHDLLVDAGTGVGDLTVAEMAGIDHVLLTHSHLDHVACLPLMIDAVAGQRGGRPVQIHALPATLDALRSHVFNDVIWPDFSRIPTPAAPLVSFHPLACGQTLRLGGRQVEVLPAVHTVPAVGYAVAGAQGASWVFTGDTAHNPALWARLNRMDVAMLVIETAFSNREASLAQRSRHLCPHSLAQGLDCIAPGRHYPIYFTHLKPAEKDLIMAELQELLPPRCSPGGQATHRFDCLRAGQVFEL